MQALKSSGKSGISLDDMHRVKPWFTDMLISTGITFNALTLHAAIFHITATTFSAEPFPVSIPAIQSSQGLKHELTLRVSLKGKYWWRQQFMAITN